LGYGLYDPGLNPVIGEKLFIIETSKPAVRPTRVTGVFFPENKVAVEADHLLLSRVYFKNEWSCASTPVYLRGVCTGTFTAALGVRSFNTTQYSIWFYAKRCSKSFLFRQYRHIRRQVNVFSLLGEETQGNFQGKNVSTEAESVAFSELNERCFEEHV
jgi:hypothetical protein